jgi:hypothetical protein
MEGEHSEKKEIGDSIFDLSDILQPSRIRRTLRSCDEIDRILLGYRRNFLLPFGIILWAVLAHFIV